MRRILCGVPKGYCKGADTAINAGLGKSMKTHATNQEAFNCHCAYLKTIGFKKLSKREYTLGPDEPIRLLGKPAKFGAPLRGGKRVVGASNSRVEPYKGKACRAGTIIIT